MSSMTVFILFVSIIAVLFLVINFLLAPHSPYQEKYSIFECGFHSFLGQNRMQFGIKFFVFALIYLLFDLEILIVFPFTVSAYNNNLYGLIIVIIFLTLITTGFVYEISKKALSIDSRQNLTEVKVKPSYNIQNLNKSQVGHIKPIKHLIGTRSFLTKLRKDRGKRIFIKSVSNNGAPSETVGILLRAKLMLWFKLFIYRLACFLFIVFPFFILPARCIFACYYDNDLSLDNLLLNYISHMPFFGEGLLEWLEMDISDQIKESHQKIGYVLFGGGLGGNIGWSLLDYFKLPLGSPDPNFFTSNIKVITPIINKSDIGGGAGPSATGGKGSPVAEESGGPLRDAGVVPNENTKVKLDWNDKEIQMQDRIMPSYMVKLSEIIDQKIISINSRMANLKLLFPLNDIRAEYLLRVMRDNATCLSQTIQARAYLLFLITENFDDSDKKIIAEFDGKIRDIHSKYQEKLRKLDKVTGNTNQAKEFYTAINNYRNDSYKILNEMENLIFQKIKISPFYNSKSPLAEVINKLYPDIKKDFKDADALQKKTVGQILNQPSDEKANYTPTAKDNYLDNKIREILAKDKKG